MFFTFALLSSLGYVLQGVLLVRFARSMDALSLVFYRNISFVVTLLPLLLTWKSGQAAMLLAHAGHFALAGVLGALHLFCAYEGMRSLSAGSNNALTSASTTVAIVVGSMFLGQHLTLTSQILIFALAASAVVLGFGHQHFDHLDGRVARGLSLSLLAGIPGAGTKMLLARITNDVTPLVAGYVWEVSIGLASAVLIGCIFLCRREHVQRVSIKTALGIALASSPTLLGTGAFALAITMGPLSLVQAIGSGTSLVLMGVLPAIFYHEHLKLRQWIPILCIALLIVILRLFS